MFWYEHESQANRSLKDMSEMVMPLSLSEGETLARIPASVKPIATET
jgi:hypothetical protein